jgi:hypothetical protein
MPQDHRTSKADFPLAEAQRLRAEGKSFQDVADDIGWSQAQTRRYLMGEVTPDGDAPPPEPTTPTPADTTHTLRLTDIIIDQATQQRESVDLAVIADYAEQMSEGAKFPPITVFSNGMYYWLADGYQRFRAVEQIGYQDIRADVRSGSLRDAILYSCGANSEHGKQRSAKDKRTSVLTLLRDPEWQQWSDRKIADVCKVSNTLVSEIRNKMIVTVSVDSDNSWVRQRVDKHGNVSLIDTTNIGKRTTATSGPPEPPSLELPTEEPPAPPEAATPPVTHGLITFEYPQAPATPPPPVTPSLQSSLSDDLSCLFDLWRSIFGRYATVDDRVQIMAVVNRMLKQTMEPIPSERLFKDEPPPKGKAVSS